MWTHDIEKEKEFLKHHALPSVMDIKLNDNISVTASLEKSLKDTNLIYIVTTSNYFLSLIKKAKVFYNGQFQTSNNDNSSMLNSVRDGNAISFETLNEIDNIQIKQFVEWHKQINNKHTTTFVVNQSYDNNKPQNTWLTDTEFLTGLIPLENDSFYNIQQIKKVQNKSIEKQ